MSKLKVPVSKDDHTLGSWDAPITLVEYGDYQCPFCAMAHMNLRILIREMPNELRLVFRNFPLTQAHEYAFLGAMAAESAGLQDRFWEMHDLIYENQELLGPDGIFRFASDLDLDLEAFQSGLDNDELKERIRDDFLGGVRSGVSGTPGIFVNGETYRGPLEVPAIRRLLTPSEPAESPIA